MCTSAKISEHLTNKRIDREDGAYAGDGRILKPYTMTVKRKTSKPGAQGMRRDELRNPQELYMADSYKSSVHFFHKFDIGFHRGGYSKTHLE